MFKNISSFYPDKESVRTQLCQFAYGVHDKSLAGDNAVIYDKIIKNNGLQEKADQKMGNYSNELKFSKGL